MNSARPQTTGTSALEQRHYIQPADLFPNSLPPILPATWPKAGTLEYDVLSRLKAGPLTQADYGESWRLAAYVLQLSQRGWRINRSDVVKPGFRTPITEYSLDRTDPRTAAAVASRHRGFIDSTLARLLAFIIACVVLLMRSPITLS